MIRIIITTISLLTMSGAGQAQLLTQVVPGKVERAAKVPSNFEGKTTLHFVRSFVYFTSGECGALFRCGDGDTLRLLFLHPFRWSEKACKKSAQPIAVEVRRDDERVLVEIVHNSAFEKRLVEFLTYDLVNGKHDRDDVQTLTEIRDSLRSRQPPPKMQELVKCWLKIFQDPDAAPPEIKGVVDVWLSTMAAEQSDEREPE